MSEETVPQIAVVGLAARYPGARTVDELWRNLRDGVESISYFSAEEMAAAGVDPRLLADPHYVRAKGVLPDADLFDAAFFGFTPREAELMDPQHRVFLECAWAALEDAGCDPQRSGDRVGVFAGAGASAYLISNLLPHREMAEAAGVLQLLLLNDRDFLATRTSYKLGLTGPSVAVQTACSTSLVAIHLACQSLLTGECDLVLAGGVSVSTPLTGGYLYQEGSILSPDGHCRAFDAEAAGSVEANGCGVVVLKRLADAQADGDHIYAVVRGSAVTNDGPARVGFTAPGVDGQAAAISEALLVADVDPDSIGYVETHGSGTALGDPIEMEALTRAFRRAGARRTGTCAVGSVKTHLGHCSAGSGAAGFLSAVLALANRTIPPTLHYQSPNPRIDFATSPFYVCNTATPWETEDGPRRAGVSSFGLGGTNVHVVLEEAPAVEPSDPPSREPQMLVLSARTPEALDLATERLREHLRGGTLADIAWTLQTGRKGFEHRRFVVARDPESALAALGDSARLVTGRSEADGRRPVVFLFPGLGDQAVDMAREIYASEPVFREQVDLCAAKLQPLLGCDLRDVLFSAGDWSPSTNPGQAPDLRALLRREPSGATQLDQTAFAQPACFVVEYALARQLMDWGIEPEAMIGYSIGEYVAACLAGALSLDDVLTLVARRAQLIQALPSGAMLAVPLTEDEVRPLLGDRLSIAATNGPHFCVVSGPEDAVGELDQLLAGRGASCLRLQTTHAFHSSMMEPAVAELTELARGIATQAPRIPYLSNVTGTWITPEDLADPAYWALHMQGTVRFAEGLDELLREPGRAYVEAGPGGTLVTLLRQHPNAANAPVAVPTLRRTGGSGSDLDDLLLAAGRLWASGAPLDWERFHGGARRCRVPLPTYPFERRRFWIDPPKALAPSAREIAAEPLRTLDLEDWFWVPSWKQVPLVRSTASSATGSWLIFLDRHGLGERLAGRLRTAGHAVTTVVPGVELADLGSGAFAIHPGRRQDYDALLQRLRAAGGLPERILHLWSVTAEEPSFAEAQTSGLLSLVLLAQALAGDGSEESQIRITLVANGLSELDGGSLHPAKATTLGALRIVHQEMPRLACGGLLIALSSPGSPQESLLIGQILAELQAPATEPLVAFHAGQRWLRSVEPVRLPEPGGSLLAAEGVYLVVGDEHGPAVPLAEHLLHLGARVALVLPHRPGKANDRLLLLEAGPGDAAGLRAAFDRTRVTLGPVRGAFHAPGFTGGLIQWKTLDGLRSALEPAAHGALALLAAAGEEQPPLDFVVLSSSTFTTTGGLGQLETAAAGAFLDALCLERSTRGGPLALSVAWDPFQWDGWLAATATGVTGLGSQAIEKSLESYRVGPAQSGEALRRLLAYGLPRAIVSARDLRALIAETEAATADALRVQETGHQGPRAPRPELSIPYVAPRTETEARMAGIWEELFGIEPIGVEDSFLELGGHSLLAIQIMTHLRSAFDVELPVTAIFETPTVAGLASAVAQQHGGETEEDLELLALIESLSPEEVAERLGETAELSEERGRPPQPRQPPPVLPRSGPAGIGDWPLSFDQERLLQLHLDNPELVSWNVDAGTRILGPLQVPDLLAAFAAVVRRHAAWRTTFPVINRQQVQRVQRVHPWIAPHVSVIDLTGLPEEMREPTAHATLFERTRDVYDLEHGPLVRIALARLGEREHLCLIGVHHVITDWITFQVCWRELLTFYEARRGGHTVPLPPLPVQYPDFVLWEREWLQGAVLEESAEFWRQRLAGFPLALELPTDHPRPPVQSQRGGLYRVQAGAERTDRLRNLARREGVTMFMAVMAVLDALLHRFSGKDKIIVGSNSANRPRQELEQVFGLFLTQIPFPVDLSGDPAFRELLARVRQSALASYSHQNFPFSKLIEALGVEPDPQRNPVVQVLLLVLEGQSQMHAGDLDFHGVPLFDGSTRWDLTFGLYDYHDIGLAGPLEYNADIFEDATIGRLLELFYRLIDAVTADPDIRLSQLPAFGDDPPDGPGLSLPEEVAQEVGGLR